MNRNQVNTVAAAMMSLIEAHKDEYPALQNVDVARAGGTYGSGYYKMKLSITPKITEESQAAAAAQTTPRNVLSGFAPAGTPVWCRIRGGVIQNGAIVKANRTRYVIKGIGGKYDGEEFTYPMAGTFKRELQATGGLTQEDPPTY